MAAPSPDLIVSNPAPLNAATKKWPFRVLSFPAQWLLGFAGLGRGYAPREREQGNALRVED